MNQHEDFPFEPATIAQLETLSERYFPSKQPEKQGKQAQQGRAGVTKRKKTICPVCKQPFVKEGHAAKQIYCSKSCQQRAYRMRKKAG